MTSAAYLARGYLHAPRASEFFTALGAVNRTARFTVGLAAGKKQAHQAQCRGQRSLGCAASAAPCSNGTSARELPPEHKHASPRPRSCNPLRSPLSAAFCPQDTARRPATAEAHPRQTRGNAQKKVRTCDIARAIPSAMHMHIAPKIRTPEKITDSRNPHPMSAGAGSRLFQRRQDDGHRFTIESEVLI